MNYERSYYQVRPNLTVLIFPLEAFQEAPAPAINDLTTELRTRLSQEVIIINEREDEALVENLLQLYRTEIGYPPKPAIGDSDKQLRGEKAIAEAVNSLAADRKQELSLKSHDYFSRLTRMRINDEALMGNYKRSQGKTSSVIWGAIPALLRDSQRAQQYNLPSSPSNPHP